MRLPWQKRGSVNLKNTPKGWILDWLGVSKSSSGIDVNKDTAISFTAVWSAVKLLSESIAGLPIQVFKREGDKKELDRENSNYNLLHSEPNPWMSSNAFHQAMAANVLLSGNAYATIHRDQTGDPKWLEIIDPQKVTVSIKNLKWYTIEGMDNKIPDRNMIHVMGLSFDGLIGKDVISICSESIGLGLAAEKFGAKFFGSGANMTGVLEYPLALSPDQRDNLSKSWDKKHAGLDNSGGTAVLEGGMKYNRIGIPPEQAQFILTRQFQVTEVARLWNIPPHMIGDLLRSTNNNIEQQSIEFVQYALMPWIKRFEQEYNRKLFRESDKGKYYVEFNVQGLLRGDAVARAEYYTKMWGIGNLSNNEIRGLENKNPVENGDKHFVPLNMIPVENIGKDEQGKTNI